MGRLIKPNVEPTKDHDSNDVKDSKISSLKKKSLYYPLRTFDLDVMEKTVAYANEHSYRYLEDIQRSIIIFTSRYFKHSVVNDTTTGDKVNEGSWYIDKRDNTPCFVVSEDIVNSDYKKEYYKSKFYKKKFTLKDISNNPKMFDRFPIIVMGSRFCNDVTIELDNSEMIIKIPNVTIDNYDKLDTSSEASKSSKDIFIMIVSNIYYKEFNILPTNSVGNPSNLYNENTRQIIFTKEMIGLDSFRKDGTYFIGIKTPTNDNLYIHDCYIFTKDDKTYLTPHIDPSIIEREIITSTSEIKYSIFFVRDLYAYRGFDSDYCKYYNESDKKCESIFKSNKYSQASLCKTIPHYGYTQDGDDVPVTDDKCTYRSPYVHLYMDRVNGNSSTGYYERELAMPIPIEHIFAFVNDVDTDVNSTIKLYPDKILRYLNTSNIKQHVLNIFQLYPDIKFKENNIFKFFFLYKEETDSRFFFKYQWFLDAIGQLYGKENSPNPIQDVFNGYFYRKNKVSESLIRPISTNILNNKDKSYEIVSLLRLYTSIENIIIDSIQESSIEYSEAGIINYSNTISKYFDDFSYKIDIMNKYCKYDYRINDYYVNNRDTQPYMHCTTSVKDIYRLNDRIRLRTGEDTLPSFDVALKEQCYVFYWQNPFIGNDDKDDSIMIRIDGMLISNMESFYVDGITYIYIPTRYIKPSSIIEMDVRASLFIDADIFSTASTDIFKFKIPYNNHKLYTRNIYIGDTDTNYDSNINTNSDTYTGELYSLYKDYYVNTRSKTSMYYNSYFKDKTVNDTLKSVNIISSSHEDTNGYKNKSIITLSDELVIKDETNDRYDPVDVDYSTIKGFMSKITNDIAIRYKDGSYIGKNSKVIINATNRCDDIIVSTNRVRIPITETSIHDYNLFSDPLCNPMVYISGRLYGPLSKVNDKSVVILDNNTCYLTDIMLNKGNSMSIDYTNYPLKLVLDIELLPTITYGNNKRGIIISLPDSTEDKYSPLNIENYEIYSNGRKLTEYNVFPIGNKSAILSGLRSFRNLKVYWKYNGNEIFNNPDTNYTVPLQYPNTIYDNYDLFTKDNRLRSLYNNDNKYLYEFLKYIAIRNLIDKGREDLIEYLDNNNVNAESSIYSYINKNSAIDIENDPNGKRSEYRRFYYEEILSNRSIDCDNTFINDEYIKTIYNDTYNSFKKETPTEGKYPLVNSYMTEQSIDNYTNIDFMIEPDKCINNIEDVNLVFRIGNYDELVG